MANSEGGSVNRTRPIDDGNAIVNSGSMANRHDPDPASDTEQHGGMDVSSQKMGSKKKACFQITHVVSKAANNDGTMDDPDSNDELDESRADEFSSSELIDSFNMSRNSISDLNRSVEDGNGVPSLFPASGSVEEQTNSITSNANQANGNGPHRFKVVKVATEPIRKGRWICRDFPSESAKGGNQTTPEGLRNQDPNKETLVHSGNSSAASSVHYVHGQDNYSDNPLNLGEESGKPSDLSRKISSCSTSSKDAGNRHDSRTNEDQWQKDDRLGLVEQLKDELYTSESTEGDAGTSPAGGAIDNKIEQAMDLVKSHLLFAVREEVEVLKEQIKILVEKNEELIEENKSLRKRIATGAPSTSMAMTAPQTNLQHQGMPMQQPSQEQPKYPNMPNQMGQTLSDHAAYPQHPRSAQQTHSTPNPGGIAESSVQYTPQTSVESQGQYHVHSQRHVQTGQAAQQPPQHLPQGMQDMSQYSQVGGAVAAAPAQTQGQFHPTMTPGATGGRPSTNH